MRFARLEVFVYTLAIDSDMSGPCLEVVTSPGRDVAFGFFLHHVIAIALAKNSYKSVPRLAESDHGVLFTVSRPGLNSPGLDAGANLKANDEMSSNLNFRKPSSLK